MPATFQEMLPLLTHFEQHYINALNLSPVSLPPTAPGSAQFIALQPAKSSLRMKIANVSRHSAEAKGITLMSGDEISLPVIVAIGVNYGQDRRQLAPLKPTCVRSYLTPTIVDFDSQMRPAIEAELAAFKRNKKSWCNVSVPMANQVPDLEDFILIATNFSPFMTSENWGELTRKDQSAIFKACPGTKHLDDLYKLIGHQVDLWIGHGKEYGWPLFDSWRTKFPITSWIKTFNLSGLGTLNVARKQRAGCPQYK